MSSTIVHTLICHWLIRGTLTRCHFQRLKGPWVKKSDHYGYHNDLLFSLDQMTRKIARLSTLELVKSSNDPGYWDVPIRNAFQSSARHTDVKREQNSKFGSDAYLGPYEIVQINKNSTFRVNEGVITDTCNIRNITPYLFPVPWLWGTMHYTRA